ncbi:hypothetical protein L228DRAFT_237545 [Xylona heveae TC161]|uniref:Uncharacterized protein n=1 Tax=Xylona heveae (strain CBS 132557 / TC161) TaxID=1328760 RepID=A0A165IAQ0_XYLHT|nr:hypothetical protein L228DRAFT_237545 [Xylona heveae TC161]KZF24633.1 hypothetical protein L228DRAFT_237545 [Xylona heveae TC161]
MGNAQSSPAGKPQNKLSKPRTNSSPNNILAPSAKPSPVSSVRSTPERALDEKDEELGITHQGTRDEPSNESEMLQSRRQSIAPCGDEDSVCISPVEIMNDPLESAQISELSLIARRNSMPPRIVQARTSTALLRGSIGDFPYSYKLPLPEGIDESTRLFREMRTKPSDDELTTMLSEDERRRSASMSPSRRNSLRTPGIATRDCIDDILRKQPPVPELPLSMKSKTPIQSSTQASINALDLAEPIVFSASGKDTPCGTEYSHLGGLRPRTLFVTNGAASPDSGSQTPRRFVSTEVKGDQRDNHAPHFESPLKAVTGSPSGGIDNSKVASKRLIERLSSLENQQSCATPQGRPSAPTAESRSAGKQNGKSAEEQSLFRADALQALEDVMNGSRPSSAAPLNQADAPHAIVRGRRLVDVPNRTDSGYGSQLSLLSMEREAKTASPSNEMLTVMKAPSRAPPSPPVDVSPTFGHDSAVDAAPSERPGQAIVSREAQGRIVAAAAAHMAREVSEENYSQQQVQNVPPLLKAQDIIPTSDVLPTPAESLHIPPVPSDLALKHKERLKRYPTSNHLPHTFPSLDYSGSKENFINLAPVADPLTFPSPSSDAKRPGLKKSKSLFSFHRRQKSTDGQVSEPKSRKKNPQQDPVTGISDFGTVARSLGHSPYDIAMSGPMPRPRLTDANRAQSALTPFRISTAMPRQKRVNGMTQEAAAAVSQGKANVARSKSFSRPRSIHGDADSWSSPSPVSSAPVPRPVSMAAAVFPPVSAAADAPPVPALPAASALPKAAHAPLPVSMSAEPSPTSSTSTLHLMPPAALRSIKRPTSMYAGIPTVSKSPAPSANSARPKLSRPNSMYAGIPTVPELSVPSEDSVPPMTSARPKLPRPKSMVEPSTTSTTSTLHLMPPAARRSVKRPTSMYAGIPTVSNPSATSLNPARPAQKVVANPTPQDKAAAPLRRASPALNRRSYHGRTGSAASSSSSAVTVAPATPATPAAAPAAPAVIPRSQTPGQQRVQARGLINVGDRPHSMIEASTRSGPGEHVLGRYEGGLHYGYEPGRGIGGSAGTRGLRTSASRKSMYWATGYGIDLSDVPVFVELPVSAQ